MSRSITRDTLGSLLDERLGLVISESWTREPGPTLLILCHEYIAPDQQQNLYLLIEHLLERAPGLPLLLEGKAGPQHPGRSIADPSRRKETALGRLVGGRELAPPVLAELHPGARIHGADDPEGLRIQEAKVAELEERVASFLPGEMEGTQAGLFLLSCFTSLFRPALKELEEGVLNPRLEELLALRERYYRESSPAAYAPELASLARQEGIELEGYPSLEAFVGALELERSIDFDLAEQERNALIQDLVLRSEQTLDGEPARAVDRWMQEASGPERALVPAAVEMLRATGMQASGPQCMVHLIALSLGFQQGQIPASRFNRRLMGLLDALGISLPGSSSIGRYMRYLSLCDGFRASELVSVELPALHEELAGLLTSSASEHGVLSLGSQLDDLQSLLTLTLPAARAVRLEDERPSIVTWLSELKSVRHSTGDEQQLDMEQLLGGEVGLEIERILRMGRTEEIAAFLDSLLPLAMEFSSTGLARSKHLFQEAVSAARADGNSGCLVCGRFHLYEGLRLLRGVDGLSWAVVAPHSGRQDLGTDAIAMQKRRSGWTWRYPMYEVSHPRTLRGLLGGEETSGDGAGAGRGRASPEPKLSVWARLRRKLRGS